MTPFLFGVHVEAFSIKSKREHDHSVWLIWHNAVWGRCKKMPKLSEVLKIEKKKSKGVDENAILKWFKNYNHKVGKNGNKKHSES